MPPDGNPLPTPALGAVLFDLDGTLIATRRLCVASYAQALAPALGYTPSEHGHHGAVATRGTAISR